MAFWNKDKKAKEEQMEKDLNSLKEQIETLKGGDDNKKMAEDFDDDLEGFEDEEQAPAPQKSAQKGRPMKQPVAKPVNRPQTAQQQAPAVDEDRYASYHYAESAGVKDKQTNLHYDNLYVILAEIMSKLERIGRAVGV